MTLTPEQKEAVSAWIAAGDNLSVVQKKLIEQFQITMTYRDVRFLVDDLNLALKDPAPKVDTNDVSKSPAAAAAKLASETPGTPAEDDPAADLTEEEGEAPADVPAEGSSLSVSVDKVTLLPGALASGTVTFSDGVTGKWV